MNKLIALKEIFKIPLFKNVKCTNCQLWLYTMLLIILPNCGPITSSLYEIKKAAVGRLDLNLRPRSMHTYVRMRGRMNSILNARVRLSILENVTSLGERRRVVNDRP